MLRLTGGVWGGCGHPRGNACPPPPPPPADPRDAGPAVPVRRRPPRDHPAGPAAPAPGGRLGSPHRRLWGTATERLDHGARDPLWHRPAPCVGWWQRGRVLPAPPGLQGTGDALCGVPIVVRPLRSRCFPQNLPLSPSPAGFCVEAKVVYQISSLCIKICRCNSRKPRRHQVSGDKELKRGSSHLTPRSGAAHGVGAAGKERGQPSGSVCRLCCSSAGVFCPGFP